MDRFIDINIQLMMFNVFALKSNMDRFIVDTNVIYNEDIFSFKIQYG